MPYDQILSSNGAQNTFLTESTMQQQIFSGSGFQAAGMSYQHNAGSLY